MLFHIIVPMLLFLIGLCGVFLSRKNLILIIICLELMLMSMNWLLLFLSMYLDDILGYLLIMYIIILSGTETSMGLAIMVSYYKLYSMV